VPSAIAHSSVALALGSLFPRTTLPRWAWLLGAGCAALPDLDVISFRLGISYGNVLGHRGLTHSIAFAVIVALLISLMGACLLKGRRFLPALFIFMFACTMSHGLLDAMTDGGRGVAFLAPFNNDRYFFPWRPIAVSPLSVTRFFTAAGMRVIGSEVMWVMLPSSLIALIAGSVRSSLARAQYKAVGLGIRLRSKISPDSQS
jgi:inner membrane protein